MPDHTENPDGSSPPSERESLPLRANQAGEDGGASPERALAAFDADFPEIAGSIGDFPVNHLSDELPASVLARMQEERAGRATAWEHQASQLSADFRAELEGSTEDGKSAIYVEGRYRFVTPCHVSKEGLRASQICTTCFGDLKQPVETAIMLSCGHWTTADFATGERRRMCQVPGCEEWTLIKAERVAITRYDVRPISVTEQLAFTEDKQVTQRRQLPMAPGNNEPPGFA